MQNKLFVGNLAYTATEDELNELFAQAGTVTSVALIKDKETGRSRGFAFVEMENPTMAQKAIQLFNNYSFQNRRLTVNIARPREEQGQRSGNRYGGSSNDDRRRSY
jgi:RNA recognition motif-containing protein